MWRVIFVSFSRESGQSQRGEPGHAPGPGRDPPGAQQPIEACAERQQCSIAHQLKTCQVM